MRTMSCDMTQKKTIMAAAREITPYIRLRSEFAMIKNVNKIGPISQLGRRWIVRICCPATVSVGVMLKTLNFCIKIKDVNINEIRK